MFPVKSDAFFACGRGVVKTIFSNMRKRESEAEKIYDSALYLAHEFLRRKEGAQSLPVGSKEARNPNLNVLPVGIYGIST